MIVSVENLSKRYRIQHKAARPSGGYSRLSEDLVNAAKAPLRTIASMFCGRSPAEQVSGGQSTEDFWALRDVSFEVREGEVLGIIGRNGAGKSTLLKILSRITEPSEGRVRIRGRVASLLEVGTGFHPELTGRENIFLNGAVMGMTRSEINRKFDEIVTFAEVESFLDTPVKRYSSGMYVRLAFAVAAHLDPEILVVDEVLAVGDTQFQKKCIGRMTEVAASGRTVLFVSHNLNAVESLCTEALHLEKGNLRECGSDVRGVISRYLGANTGNGAFASVWENDDDSLNHPAMQPLRFAIENSDGQPLCAPVRNDEQLEVIIRAEVRRVDPALNVGFALFDQDSELLLWSLTTDGPEDAWPKLTRAVMEFRCSLPKRFLNEGVYRLEMIASLHFREWIARPGYSSPTVYFEIQGGLSDSPYWLSARPGILAPELEWGSR